MATVQGNGFESPEAMLEAWQAHRGAQAGGARVPWSSLSGDLAQLHAARRAQVAYESLVPLGRGTGGVDFPPPAPHLEATSQTPRQWNLVTLKRCLVTSHEYHYWGSIEAVLQRKGFPAGVPEDGTILLSWFDPQAGVAYYELARAQDPGELAAYMLEHFQPKAQEGVERTIEFD